MSKKRQPRSSRELTEEYNRALAPLHSESDRGCALVAVAFLDEALTQILIRQWEKNAQAKKSAQSLLRPDGPLGGFWSKVHLCLVLGFIDPPVFKELEVVRDIRNAFAHQYGPSSFDAPKVQKLIRELLNRDMTSPGNGDTMMKIMSPRDAFIRQVIGLMGYMTATHSHLEIDPLMLFKEKMESRTTESNATSG